MSNMFSNFGEEEGLNGGSPYSLPPLAGLPASASLSATMFLEQSWTSQEDVVFRSATVQRAAPVSTANRLDMFPEEALNVDARKAVASAAASSSSSSSSSGAPLCPSYVTPSTSFRCPMSPANAMSSILRLCQNEARDLVHLETDASTAASQFSAACVLLDSNGGNFRFELSVYRLADNDNSAMVEFMRIEHGDAFLFASLVRRCRGHLCGDADEANAPLRRFEAPELPPLLF